MISFILRAHNEERAHRRQHQLLAIPIPIEIAITLHRCTYCTKDIVEALIKEAPAARDALC